ncbi:hypothetical protein J4409_01170 [Candidatus Woesearchaeota archaeon]|nr:hypothetical protein [Candidatus Woesearchaeota archaeon]
MNDTYSEKLIKDVNENDKKVAISGVIISKEENSVVIDDGSSKIAIFFDQMNVPDAKYVRVFGRVIPYQEGLQVQADIIQDLSNINYELYKKMIGMMKERAL